MTVTASTTKLPMDVLQTLPARQAARGLARGLSTNEADFDSLSTMFTAAGLWLQCCPALPCLGRDATP